MFRGMLHGAGVVAFAGTCLLRLPPLSAAAQQTSQALASSTWLPARGAPPDAHYAGRDACAECHIAEAQTQANTPMGRAAEPASSCDILMKHPVLTCRFGPYSYKIIREGNSSTYLVTDGKATVSEPILWAFGLGEAGQTYVFEHDGAYYQSRVSFYTGTQALDLTLGTKTDVHSSAEDALGDRLEARAARDCFACHTTNAVSGPELHVQTLTPGVSCEACHGPGADHITAIKAGHAEQASIFNPAKLAPGELNDFCGSCHRTSLQVLRMGIHGVANVRFQPYRLENSRCWDPDDARIGCLACHDPHRPRERDAAFYDAKCLNCHPAAGARRNADQPGKVCRVSGHGCVTCHMPKYELPGGHFKFTDHDIRIARPGAAYPG
ncbi:MAG TPA: multiheme c-type cytochrome [Terriglobia bacterium]|nr:multiheme c-type cytochrome [Terriglobia bacterium]